MQLFKLKEKEIELRKYPVPYKCALTISSDIDECDVFTFLKLHSFINTTQDTKCGPGLGLDIGDSFWFYSDNPNEMSYFEGNTEKRSRVGEIIEEFIRAGYIDCLHSYGNFGGGEPERNTWRKLVVNGINRFKKESLIVDTGLIMATINQI